MVPDIRDPQGVAVAAVAPDVQGADGPVPGDVIYAVNGERVRTLADLRTAIAGIATDSTAVIQVGRQGQLRFLTVTLE
jgi:S1-C subfamily serine protease